MIEIGLDLLPRNFKEAGTIRVCSFIKIIILNLFTYVSDVFLKGHTY